MPIGNESLYLTAESIANTSASPRSNIHAASLYTGPKIRLTTNPGTSLRHTITSFPISFDRLVITSSVSSDVLSPRMSSNNGIICGGLKKCMPIAFSGCDRGSEISVIGRVLVLVATIAPSLRWSSILRINSSFISRSSNTASITISAFSTAFIKSSSD